jgi:hypothetical protein
MGLRAASHSRFLSRKDKPLPVHVSDKPRTFGVSDEAGVVVLRACSHWSWNTPSMPPPIHETDKLC